ncbi:MAG: pyridoxal-phosphate dependent enzyme [Acidimicrobiales bacterium]
MPGPPLTIEDVRAAAGRLAGVAHRTPVVSGRSLDEATGATVVLKGECFQRGGAFKFRGAYNRISTLSEEERGAGVIAYSSGNHAQAVALAARLLGVPATVVVPFNAPRIKMDAARGYGAEMVTYDPATEDRVVVAEDLAARRRLTIVPPYDDYLVMAGQGTVALELIEDAGPLDLLVVPVGGGGLISGCATAAKALGVARVVGVEPADGDDTMRSLASGHPERVPPPRTIADGLRSQIPGRLTFPLISSLVDQVVAVTDEEMVDAMAFALERLKVVIEPSGAVGLAALLCGRIQASGLRVGVVVSGGNVELATLAELLDSRTRRTSPTHPPHQPAAPAAPAG